MHQIVPVQSKKSHCLHAVHAKGATRKHIFERPSARRVTRVKKISTLDQESAVAGGHPFHVLLPLHEASLRRFALKLSGNRNRAEDLVQETFLKAWTKRAQFISGTDLRAWLFTILRNTFYSQLRKYKREVEDVDGKLSAALYHESSQEHSVDLRQLMSAIATLPEIHRQPLVMVGVYGYSQLEAADACGCAVGTIKSRVSRGRASLNQIFGLDRP